MQGVARQTQNAWVNLVYEVTDQLHVGLATLLVAVAETVIEIVVF